MKPVQIGIGILALALAAGPTAGARAQNNPAAVAQQETTNASQHNITEQPNAQQRLTQFVGARALLETPVTRVFPGAVAVRPEIENPQADDPAAAQRGLSYFTAFNCIGCHAPNGGGGMGRALTDKSHFLYGASPANIYLTIVQGRPRGMPAWGSLLPDALVWDLVAYIEQISNAPHSEWGTTVAAGSPSIEQAPAEFTTTANPWAYTEPFSNGQNPAHPSAEK